mmetsp:Transcript_81356/g.225256  ORF Transcript_81356/g.225256 Transcript_81356/m.225256 type:complete len:106 (+) Transcript_81356:487-804(+)
MIRMQYCGECCSKQCDPDSLKQIAGPHHCSLGAAGGKAATSPPVQLDRTFSEGPAMLTFDKAASAMAFPARKGVPAEEVACISEWVAATAVKIALAKIAAAIAPF